MDDYHLSEAFAINPIVNTLVAYQKTVHKFLLSKSYRLVKVIDQNYIYRLNDRLIRNSRISDRH